MCSSDLKRFGHTLVVINETLCGSDRHASWSKLKLLNSTPDGMSCMWVDDDIILTNIQTDVWANYAATLHSASLVVSEDFRPSIFNMGMVIAVGGEKLRSVCQKIWDIGSRSPFYRFGGWWEQSAAQELFVSEPGLFQIVPFREIQAFEPYFRNNDRKRVWSPGDPDRKSTRLNSSH